MQYRERKNYNKVITVKLVIPSGCNAHCSFCYMKDSQMKMTYDKKSFIKNFLPSLTFILKEIGDKNPVSLDITGNEPTYDVELLKEVLISLRHYGIKDKVLRTTITTNGYNLQKLIPYFAGVIDYVNISVHDFDRYRRQKIMGCKSVSGEEYARMVNDLKSVGINTSVIAVISKPINQFSDWRDSFIEWSREKGFIGIRFRCDAFLEDKTDFNRYMKESLKDPKFTVITHENTPDSHWCRLRRYDGFRVFFLQGVLDTSAYTKGIEYVIADDGKLYSDFYKRTRIEDYQYEIGKIYDKCLEGEL